MTVARPHLCPRCGTPVSDGDASCPTCGLTLDGAEKTAETQRETRVEPTIEREGTD